MPLSQINNGDSGLTVRTTLNQVIDKTNLSGAQLLSTASIDLNLPISSLTYPLLTVINGYIDQVICYNAIVTYSSLVGAFTIGESISDGTYSGFVFVDNANTMSLYFPAGTVTSPAFQPGSTLTGQVSAATATIDTVVSNSFFTPGETIVGLNNFSASVISFSSSSYYSTYSELDSIYGSPEINYIDFQSGLSNPWIPGETITNIDTGATASVVWGVSLASVTIANISGSFNSGDTITSSLSSNNGVIQTFGSSSARNIFIGQTSKAVFPSINENLITTSPTSQTLTLNGGTRFVITDVLLANGSGSYVNASPAYISTQPLLFGEQVVSNGDITTQILPGPNKFIRGQGFVPPSTTAGNTLYWTNTPFGATSSADLYIYGYILE